MHLSRWSGGHAWGGAARGASSPSARPVGPVGAAADLSDANLTRATLTGADLAGADVTGVIWLDTVCPDGTNSSHDGGTCAGHLG